MKGWEVEGAFATQPPQGLYTQLSDLALHYQRDSAKNSASAHLYHSRIKTHILCTVCDIISMNKVTSWILESSKTSLMVKIIYSTQQKAQFKLVNIYR